MNEVIKNITERLKTPKALIILGIAGMVLIALSSFTGSKKTEKNNEALSEPISAEEYRSSLEESIKKTVKSITGSDNVNVIITLESGIKYSYADINESISEDKTEGERVTTGSEQKQSYITVKTADGGEEALLVTALMPEVRGVAIVCEGGDDGDIAEKIQNAVTAALNITKKRVFVTGGKSYEKR